MIFSGKILDKDTRKPLQGTTISIIPVPALDKYVPVATIANANGQFSINNERVGYPNVAHITHVGYKSQTWEFDYTDWTNAEILLEKDFKTESEVIVTSSGKKNNNLLWLLLLVPVLANNKKKTVSGIDTGTVMALGLGLVFIKGFSIFNDILAMLGIGKDKDDKEVDAEQNDPGSPFNPNYFNNSSASIGEKTSALLYANEKYNEIIGLLNEAWGYFDDDEAKVMGAFKILKTKLQVGAFVSLWHKNEGTDILEWLKGAGGFWGWPKDRLDTEEINKIIKYVSNLPSK